MPKRSDESALQIAAEIVERSSDQDLRPPVRHVCPDYCQSMFDVPRPRRVVRHRGANAKDVLDAALNVVLELS